MQQVNQFITKRMCFTLKVSILIVLIIHLFMLSNNLKNHDSMHHFYNEMDMATSGRFFLSLFGSFGSYFDLHYFNLLLSSIYITLSIVLLVELFNIKNKKNIILISAIYSSFPTISGIFSYAFTADAYFVSFLLIFLAMYITSKNKWMTLISVVLVYLAIGTYQVNLALATTILLVILIKDILSLETLKLKNYIPYIITIFFGTFFYIVHFKIYNLRSNVTAYGGISDAGNVSFKMLENANNKTWSSFLEFFLNDLTFHNLYEKLNLAYVISILVYILLIVCYKKINMKRFILLIICLVLMPYTFYLMYFISPNVYYHTLMLQNFVLLFVVGILLIELFEANKIILNLLKNIIFIIICLIGFNFTVITNIYYEKLDQINSNTHTLMTKVSYRMESFDDFNNVDSIMVIGNPSIHLNINSFYNSKVPYNIGIQYIVGDVYNTASYLSYFQGHNLIPLDSNTEFALKNSDKIQKMTAWPLKDSIKIIENTVIIKFE